MKKIILLVMVLASCSYQADQLQAAENQVLREKVAQLEKTKKVTLREDFRKAIIGKTTQEVILAIGKPASTQDSVQQGVSYCFWYYRGKTRDPITGKVDYHAQVLLKNGVVVSVDFLGGE